MAAIDTITSEGAFDKTVRAQINTNFTNLNTGDTLDDNGNEVIKTAGVASAVNEVTVTNAAAGNSPSIAATGGDTDINLTLSGKGTGAVVLGQATSTQVLLAADQPITDSSSNELVKFTKAASAVNEVTVANAATATSPSILATGGDTHVSLKVGGKGNGKVVATTGICGLSVASANSTAGDLTYTAAQILGGLYLRDCNGASRADLVPTAADLVAAIPGCVVGTSFMFALRNTSDAAETITLTTNTGATMSGTMTVAQNNTKLFQVVLTNVTGASEAYTVYSLGTLVH